IAQGRGPSKYLVALGYAGWGGGQLEGEMRQNAWLAVEADSNIVFDMPLPNRFDGALGRLGIKVDRLHLEGGHA
ncbi:MAG TPA: YqgE/AlgH family protein, partial [Xanthomonadales bacterium]|nr:YqgE/AlgH family protein [Xanthomonadales bacterium]